MPEIIPIVVKSANHGLNAPWTIRPLDELDFPEIWSVPYFAVDEPGTDGTVFVAINLPEYFSANPLGPLDGNYSIGDSLGDLSLSLNGGILDGLEGILFATTPFVFDPSFDGGWRPLGGDSAWLDAATFQALHGDLRVIAIESAGIPIPEASGWLAGGVLVGMLTLRLVVHHRSP